MTSVRKNLVRLDPLSPRTVIATQLMYPTGTIVCFRVVHGPKLQVPNFMNKLLEKQATIGLSGGRDKISKKYHSLFQIVPMNRDTLGNVGSLLQDAVDTTEDLALRSEVGKESDALSALSPKMRMAIMKNRIMKSARENKEETGEDFSANIDPGLVTNDRAGEVRSSVCIWREVA